MTIRSHRGPYRVEFAAELQPLTAGDSTTLHYIVDRRVAALHGEALARLVGTQEMVAIDADEEAKSLARLPAHVEALLSRGARRGHTLVAIGGGVVQDIVGFIASTLFRGLDWILVPTTALAQADSCIGSKSSINTDSVKNVLGTFHPPRRVVIWDGFLDTLSGQELRSGVGEMLKIHIVEGPQHFDRIACRCDQIICDPATRREFVRRSLVLKQRWVELDEFDRGPRNVLNYGHSFGHAIEAASDFAIPHGLAVTMGMDLANHVARALGRIRDRDYHAMHPALEANLSGVDARRVDLDRMLAALARDKKRTGPDLSVILLNRELVPERVELPEAGGVREWCLEYFGAGAGAA